jgi:RimJ/RimL family protein N-acetyltransferase
MELQPTHLQSDILTLRPLDQNDFDGLFAVAADPLVWEQHPNKNRYELAVFTELFEGALASKSAFAIIDKNTEEIAGTSRYYDYNAEKNEIAIGYTFIARKYWATDFNRSLKKLMLNYAFEYVDSVLFHVGETNFRSQKAVQKLGAVKIGEVIGEILPNGLPKISFEYKLEKEVWKS